MHLPVWELADPLKKLVEADLIQLDLQTGQ
jgi:hypothetical protein